MRSGLTQTLRLGMGPAMHVRRVDPTEEWLARTALLFDPLTGGGDELVIASLHALPGKRPGILDPLPSDPAPAHLLGRVILVGGPAVQHASRAVLVLESGILGIIWILGVLFGIQVI